MKVLYCGYRNWSIKSLMVLKGLCGNTEFTIAKTKKEFDILSKTKHDVTLLVGWSHILPSEYVENNFTAVIHPSDLPEYAGGSPIQNQIIDGLVESKVTLFKATSKLDEGPIIDKRHLDLSGNLTAIFNRLSFATIELIKNFLEKFPNHSEIPQKSGKITCQRRTPEMSEITIEELENCTVKELYNKIRCLADPYPNAFIKTKDGKLYITGAKYEEDDNLSTR